LGASASVRYVRVPGTNFGQRKLALAADGCTQQRIAAALATEGFKAHGFSLAPDNARAVRTRLRPAPRQKRCTTTRRVG
jgi:predicted alpha/beta-hydrolase family hydrolase